MRGKSPSSEPSGKTISSLFGVKTCKSKINLNNIFFFEPEKPQATHPFEIPRRKKKPQPTRPSRNGIKLYCEKLYECFQFFSDVVKKWSECFKLAPQRLKGSVGVAQPQWLTMPTALQLCVYAVHESVKPTSLS